MAGAGGRETLKCALTAKQQDFVTEYLRSLNALDAAGQVDFEWGSVDNCRWYTYLLIDPRDGTIFYVGKGTGDRMSRHWRCFESDPNRLKKGRIKAIQMKGLIVIERVFCSFQDESDAFACERDLIVLLRHSGLTNIARGCVGARERMQIEGRYLLAQLRSFDDWVKVATPEQQARAINLYGSLAAFYAKFEAEVEQLATDPRPNKVIVVDGEVPVFQWV